MHLDLTALAASFYLHGQYGALRALLPFVAQQRFAANFNVWGGIEPLLGLLWACPGLSEAENAALLAAFDSVRRYPHPAHPGLYDDYNQKVLTLQRLQDCQQRLAQDAAGDAKYEYTCRMALLAEAATVRALNQALGAQADAALTQRMGALIEQHSSALRQPRLLKFGTDPKARALKSDAAPPPDVAPAAAPAHPAPAENTGQAAAAASAASPHGSGNSASTVVRIPKKLAAIFDALRRGELQTGLAALDATAGFAAQKAAAHAEAAYFAHDFAQAMQWDEQMLLHGSQWYACNVFDEHLMAYVQAARLSGRQAQARAFITAQLDVASPYVAQMLKRLQTPLSGAPAPLRESGRGMSEFVAQLKKHRPKDRPDEAKGADYLLHFVLPEAASGEALAYYASVADLVTVPYHHIHAARLYHALGDSEQARACLLRFATRCFYPVEHSQIMPMALWEHDDLLPLYTPAFLRQILLADKSGGPQGA